MDKYSKPVRERNQERDLADRSSHCKARKSWQGPIQTLENTPIYLWKGSVLGLNSCYYVLPQCSSGEVECQNGAWLMIDSLLSLRMERCRYKSVVEQQTLGCNHFIMLFFLQEINTYCYLPFDNVTPWLVNRPVTWFWKWLPAHWGI